MSPLYIANIPIKNNKYLAINIGFNIPLEAFILAAFKTRYAPNKNKRVPWKRSPNITANKNGKVIIVNKPGLISLYLGIPYVLTIS